MAPKRNLALLKNRTLPQHGQLGEGVKTRAAAAREQRTSHLAKEILEVLRERAINDEVDGGIEGVEDDANVVESRPEN